MTNLILAIDHLMVHVPSSQEAGAVFEKLGFTATPRSALPGLSNRLVCFGDTPSERGICNYIELMALEDATGAPPPMPQLLDAYGPVSTVMAVDDAHAVTRRLTGEGMKIDQVLDLQRDWALRGGEIITPSFTVAIPELGQAPIYWNYCAHKTAHHYVRPDFVDHPNGALRFDEVYVFAADPVGAAAHYTTHWQAGHDGNRLALPEGPTLRLLAKDEFGTVLPDGLADANKPGIKALRVLVGDIAKAKSVVEAGGTETVPVAGGFGVRATDAVGCALLFEAGDAADR